MKTLILDLETVGFDENNQDSLSPYDGQIISLGMYDLERDLGSVYFVGKADIDPFSDGSFDYKSRTEKELLEDFWETAKDYDVLVTFNGRAFDLPFIYMRSLALEVKPTVEVAKQRFVTKQSHLYHVDLLDEYSFHGSVSHRPSLARLCETFSIDNPKLHMRGEEVTEHFLDKKVSEIARYNAGDVIAIKALYGLWFNNLAPQCFINTLEMT